MQAEDSITIPPNVLQAAEGRRADHLRQVRDRIALLDQGINSVPAYSNTADSTWMSQRQQRIQARESYEAEAAGIESLQGAELVTRYCAEWVEAQQATAEASKPEPLSHGHIEAMRATRDWNEVRQLRIASIRERIVGPPRHDAPAELVFPAGTSSHGRE
jgi:hypothetical protein